MFKNLLIWCIGLIICYIFYNVFILENFTVGSSLLDNPDVITTKAEYDKAKADSDKAKGYLKKAKVEYEKAKAKAKAKANATANA